MFTHPVESPTHCIDTTHVFNTNPPHQQESTRTRRLHPIDSTHHIINTTPSRHSLSPFPPSLPLALQVDHRDGGTEALNKPGTAEYERGMSMMGEPDQELPPPSIHPPNHPIVASFDSSHAMRPFWVYPYDIYHPL